MELLEHLRRQFDYDAWANRETLAAIQAGQGPTAPPLKLLAHILSAECLWLERLKRQSQSMPVWPELTLEQCESQISDLGSLWREYFSGISSTALAETISYQNTKGETWTNTVQDVLAHTMMHSAYHRGQIASLMRASGAAPAYTDFIHAVRQGSIK